MSYSTTIAAFAADDTPNQSAPRKPTRAERARRLRELKREKRLKAEAEAAALAEIADEELAPGVQRRVITDAAGNAYRMPTVVRDGVTFKRASPISHLVNCGGATFAHGKAAERLARAWEDGGRGVGKASGGYGERTATTPQTGYISDVAIAAIAYQTRCRLEYAAAQTYCGGLFSALQRVALEGIDITAWGREKGWEQRVAKGYVVAALDRLVEFYAAMDKDRELPPVEVGIRSAVVVSK